MLGIQNYKSFVKKEMLMSICIYLQYGDHAMKIACANDAQAVLYLFSVIGCCVDSKGYPNERKGNHFIGIEAFTEIEDGNK